MTAAIRILSAISFGLALLTGCAAFGCPVWPMKIVFGVEAVFFTFVGYLIWRES